MKITRSLLLVMLAEALLVTAIWFYFGVALAAASGSLLFLIVFAITLAAAFSLLWKN